VPWRPESFVIMAGMKGTEVRVAGWVGRLLARLRTRRSTAAGGLAALLLSLVAAAFGHGYPASRVSLSGGGAWLASASEGIVTLIDGASDQVVGSIRAPGAGRGDALSVVQSGQSAYVVNRSAGTVSQVDGATYEPSAPVRFGAGGNSPDVYPGGGALYVVDGGRRLASVTDPRSLEVRQRLSLAAQPGPGQSVVDEHGRLWIVDGAGGGLTRVGGGDKQVRLGVGDRSSQLVLVRGEPVLIDLSHRRLGSLTATGTVRSWSCLEVRPDEPVCLLGSATSARVFAAVPATGTLVVSSLQGGDCSTTVVVGERGDDFGPLAEAAGFVFVPNRSTGHIAVVDATAGRVAADLAVVKRDSRLELIAKDGFVFYNDVDGDQAGVIRFEGGEWRAGRGLKKYGAADGGKGLLTPAGGAQENAPPPPDTPGQNTGKPEDRGTPPQDNRQQPPPGPKPGTGTPTGPPPVVAPVIRDITWSPGTPVRGLPATFTGQVANADGASWRWTLTAATARSRTPRRSPARSRSRRRPVRAPIPSSSR
jgi:DNA-binding beta-propeller fold protein YncE